MAKKVKRRRRSRAETLRASGVIFRGAEWKARDARAWLRRVGLKVAGVGKTRAGDLYARLKPARLLKPADARRLVRVLPHGVALIARSSRPNPVSHTYDPWAKQEMVEHQLEKMSYPHMTARDRSLAPVTIVRSQEQWRNLERWKELDRKLNAPTRDDDWELVELHVSPLTASESPLTDRERWDVFKHADGYGSDLDAKTLNKMGFDWSHVAESTDKGVKAMARRVRALLRKKGPPHAARTQNPPARAVRVYPRIVAIEARKADGKLYRHDFSSRNPILGLPDGSILIPAKPNKPLWGSFK